MSNVDVTVEVPEGEAAEIEAPPVVVVEDNSSPIPDQHEQMHAEHETRHIEQASHISDGFDRVESTLSELVNRVEAVENRLAHTEQVTESVTETVEQITEEIENGNPTPEEPPEPAGESLSVSEPEPDILGAAESKPHWLRRIGW